LVERADDIIDELYHGVDVLHEFPQIGRAVPEFDDPTRREILKFPYRIMYELVDGNVHITAVIHGARDFKV